MLEVRIIKISLFNYIYLKITFSIYFIVKSLGKKGGKIGAIVEKKIMPVETDPAKLVNYCCANYLTAENPIQV